MYGHLADEVKRARETLELILALAEERGQPFIAELAREALHPRDYLGNPYPGELIVSRPAGVRVVEPPVPDRCHAASLGGDKCAHFCGAAQCNAGVNGLDGAQQHE